MKWSMWVLGLAVLISVMAFTRTVFAEEAKKASKTLAECVAECNELTNTAARATCIDSCE